MSPAELLIAISDIRDELGTKLEACEDGILLVHEASSALAQADRRLRELLSSSTRAFRIYDRDQQTTWWPGDIKYLPKNGCGNIRKKLESIEQVLAELEKEAPSAGGLGRRPPEPTGWQRVDRALTQVAKQLRTATNEEDFQAIGLYCREILISAAQAVYDPEKHRSVDGVVPSSTDAKRQLEAFIASEIPGSSNEAIRTHVRSALTLANDLQHRRTANYLQAALCIEAVTAAVNTISLVARHTSLRSEPDMSEGGASSA